MRRTLLTIGLLLLSLCSFADSLLQGGVTGAPGWTGRAFGQRYVITIVGWQPAPTTNDQGPTTDLLLGVFEGANRPDFMDAVPLHIITEASATGQMNYARINCSRGFQYVRFVAPDGKADQLPELEFYGDAGAGDDSQLCQLTNLPTVSIHTRDNKVPYDKEHEIDCFISVISNDGRTLLTDSATIRERGNASRSFPKKPYRIKFAHKHQVLNAPANARKWTLINNYGDKTLMRNQLAFELSRRMGMPYTPFCAYVDVLLNGDYKGCYQLCDQIEVRKNRVDITEMTPRDNAGEALTGGYFIEADAYAYEEKSIFWSDKGTGVTIKSPDEDSITSQQTDYIRRQYNRLESNWKNNLDLNTFLRHFLVGELSGNTDTYWSLFLYKRRSNDTIFVGPVWDYDLAFDNDDRTYPVNNKSDYIYRSGGSTTGYLKTLVDKIVVNDAGARKQLAELWASVRMGGLTEEAMTAYVDEQAALLDRSQRLNFIRWPIMNKRVHQNPKIWGSYKAEVDNVRRFLTNRIQWLDRKLGFDASRLDIELTRSPLGEGRGEGLKLLIDGSLYILIGDKTYDSTGRLVK